MNEKTEKQLLCKHEDFACNVAVGRLTDSGRFMADVTIKCAQCDLPFSFKGLDAGLDLEGARISPDGLEARLAISPGIGGMFVPQEPTRSGLRGFGISEATE
jgi:hypothetical protein